jgi:hypothetical protein
MNSANTEAVYTRTYTFSSQQKGKIAKHISELVSDFLLNMISYVEEWSTNLCNRE